MVQFVNQIYFFCVILVSHTRDGGRKYAGSKLMTHPSRCNVEGMSSLSEYIYMDKLLGVDQSLGGTKVDEYEVGRSLVNITYQNWITKELFSLGWFVILGVILSVYAVWLKLLDKSRVRDILLFGSLSSVGFMLADVIFGSYFGFTSHGISLVPLKPAFFSVSITVTPVLFMLVYQYTSSWRSYTMWLVICTAALSFGLAPLYMKLGIFQYHKGWNHFFTFLRSFTDGMIARAIVLWLTSVEQSHPALSRVSQRFFDVQPAAAKPLDHDKGDKTDNG